MVAGFGCEMSAMIGRDQQKEVAFLGQGIASKMVEVEFSAHAEGDVISILCSGACFSLLFPSHVGPFCSSNA